ncbi:MAG: phytoene desaturase family protein [Candidatus Omnitrophota bacterium]
MKKVVIIGSGLGGLATALRLAALGCQVTVIEKYSQPGGRLNQIRFDGFTFDLGPSFMSMSYELKEFFADCGVENPLELQELDPLYQVFFEGRPGPYRIWKNLSRLEEEFKGIEPRLAFKAGRYLKRAGEFYHDTQPVVIKNNFYGYADYLSKLSRVPVKHLPFLFQNMWQSAAGAFSSKELRMVFSLVAFFLGTTPFRTPAIYSLLNYVEFQHDGYWAVKGGMYRIVEALVKILKEKGVDFVFDAEIKKVVAAGNKAVGVEDKKGNLWGADIFICNADAASFRGEVLRRVRYQPRRLDRMSWGMAPFTVYLGVKEKIKNLQYHNYFLGNNFQEYAGKIFTSKMSPEKPYYYVHVPSKFREDCAPPGGEGVFILCPVPDLRFKKDWSDKEELARHIILDLSNRINFDISKNIIARRILTPRDWEEMLGLYQGSGLSLCHGLDQVGALRPRNKDEQLENFYYVGASTIPGGGLPMVVIGSKLTLERIQNDHALS